MLNDEINFLFGRLNIIANYKDKSQYLLDSLQRGIVITKRESNWGFYNISIIEIEGKQFYSGYLVKYKNEKEEEIVDEKNKVIKTTTVNNRTIASSPFFLQPHSGVIAFHPINGLIGHEQFRKVFAELIKAANDFILMDAEITFIEEETTIIEAIKSFDKIMDIRIELHPSNPSSRDLWRRTDDKLRRMGVEKYKQQYHSEKGLAFGETDEVYGDIIMASDGYGKAKIVGTKSGRIYTAKTEDTPASATGLRDCSTHEMLESIYFKYLEIWRRIEK